MIRCDCYAVMILSYLLKEKVGNLNQIVGFFPKSIYFYIIILLYITYWILLLHDKNSNDNLNKN